MNMESPVRICLGAALVVNLLLLSSTIVSGNALPHETNSTTAKVERNPRHGRLNGTSWVPRQNVKSPDTSLNELSPKESSTEEHTEKNAKYKHRGRVRYSSVIKSTTETPLRRVRTSTEASNVIIVTPTPEAKKPAQIIDSMRTFKRTKMPVVSSTTESSSTSASTKDPVSIIKNEAGTHSEEEEYEDNEEEEEKESFEKYTASNFNSNFFTIPSYNDDFSDFTHKHSDKKVGDPYTSSSFSGFSTFFPSFGPKVNDHESFKSPSYFEFEGELTTPKNDFFDKKYNEISKSIMKNLASVSTKTTPSNITNVHKIVTQNLDLERLGNNTPSNKSTVYIKNTKEIRVLDNESAGSANKALSDVQGTSIYYEMSVLSTETYAIDHSDDDCENETLSLEPTISTSAENELASVKLFKAPLFPGTTKPTYPDPITSSTKLSLPDTSLSHNKKTYSESSEFLAKSTPTSTKTTFNPSRATLKSKLSEQTDSTKTIYSSSPESISTSSSNFLPVSNLIPTIYNSGSPLAVSTQNSINSISSTEKSIKVFSSSYTRNRSYSKRINLNGTNDNLNSVTSANKTEPTRSQTRRFYHTTPKIRTVWMSPRRNISRVSPTRPTTIYSEHFNIKDKYFTTPKPVQSNRTTLTTVSSEIDPVLQTDVGGVEKVVHSPSISDNSIPSVWKRGSTKFTTSPTATESDGISDLEIPPTLTAWALASLRSPPSQQTSSIVNNTGTTHKSVDENELQKVGDVMDKKDISTTSTTTTTSGNLNNDIETKKVIKVDRNQLPWTPVFIPTKIELSTESPSVKSETQPAESVISVKSSAQPPVTTESMINETTLPESDISEITRHSWIPVIGLSESNSSTELETNPPTRTTGFESITKLPSGLTTPQDETAESSEQKKSAVVDKTESKLPTTTDYEITTIRFSYIPTEKNTETNETETSVTPTANTMWHAVFPTRTRLTTIKDVPITTYRPAYTTTTQVPDETTATELPETTVASEVSYEAEYETKKMLNATEMKIQTTTTPPPSTASTTIEATTVKTTTTEEPTTATVFTTTSDTTIPLETTTSIETTLKPETTSIVTEVVTEINTEIQIKQMTTETPTTIESRDTSSSDLPETDCTSEEDSVDSNEIITEEPIKATSVKTTTEIETAPKITTTETQDLTSQETTTIDESRETTKQNENIYETTVTNSPTEAESTTQFGTRLEDEMGYSGDMTTEAIPRISGTNDTDDTSSGAAIAIAVSTIGVIALILLIGLLLVVRRRGRRGVYAQRCTPVSLDAYSLDSVSVGHRKGNHRLRASKRSYGNPAYDDEVTSHPMQYAALANFAMDVESMTAEFAEIPSVTVRPDEVPPGCEDKNRYSNVLPLPETRVPLKRIGNDPTTEYINANYITGPGNIRNYYIACQAPLSNTVVDFWRMIWEQNSRLIVMLTEYMENGVEKCYEYLPPSEVSDNKRTFGDYQIILKKREQRDKYAISTVQLVNLATRTWREITHMWYFWPAKGVPDDYDSVIEFLTEMRSYMKISQTGKEYDEEGVEVIYGDQNRSSYGNLSKLRSDENGSGNGLNVYSPAKAEEQMRRGNVTNGTLGRMKAASEVEGVRPCVVTCASGAGRAAALIAADVCARALASGAADVPRVVRELRAQRPHALANKHHYIFLYKVLSEYGNKLMGVGVDTI